MDPRHLKKIPLVLFVVVWGMVFFGVTPRNTSWVFWIHRIPGDLFGVVLVFIVSVFAFSAWHRHRSRLPADHARSVRRSRGRVDPRRAPARR